MGEMPLITVIVPVYNIIPYLPRCVHSITAQTYSNLEILLIDDGSTDGTGALCDELAKEDNRIRVIHKENGGSSSARNMGLDQAKGEYIGFVDSDDFISDFMYEQLLQGLLAQSEMVLAAQTGRDEIDEEGNLLPNLCQPVEKPFLLTEKEDMQELLLHRGDCSFCTKLLHRSVFAGHRFPVGVLNEDFHLLLEILPQLQHVLVMPGQGYHVFYRMGSNSRKKSPDEFSRVFGDNVDNALWVENLVAERYPGDAHMQQLALRFGVIQRLDYLLHIPISQMNRGGKDPVSKQYTEIVAWMRSHFWKALGNADLSAKNKIYHMLFAVAPKGIRVLHRKLKRLDANHSI